MKKGYTLVELLAVLAILAIIISLIAVNAVSLYNKRKQEDYNNIKKIIESNAKVYVDTTSKNISKNIDSVLSTNRSCKLSYDILVDNNLMDKDVVDADGNVLYNNNKYIIIRLNSTTYDYSYSFTIDDTAQGYVDCINTNN